VPAIILKKLTGKGQGNGEKGAPTTRGATRKERSTNLQKVKMRERKRGGGKGIKQ